MRPNRRSGLDKTTASTLDVLSAPEPAAKAIEASDRVERRKREKDCRIRLPAEDRPVSSARRPATLAARWWRLRWRDRALLAEALLVISLARLALVTLPFRQVVRLAAIRPAKPRADDTHAHIIGRTRWAVRAVARRVPFRAMCLEQGLTARVLLRRRGVATTLHYGVAKDREGRLAAHLWVRSGPLDVIGTENADQFTLVATFPPREQAGDTFGDGHAH